MSHDSHYHRVDASSDVMVEFPGTAQACPVCGPTREPPPKPTPVPTVPTRLSEATQVPTSRRRASSVTAQ